MSFTSGNRRGTWTSERSRFVEETEGRRTLCHRSWRPGEFSDEYYDEYCGQYYDGYYDEYSDEYYDECNDECYWAFGQAGPRGGPEEVLEFSKRTAEQVKAILDQGQVS